MLPKDSFLDLHFCSICINDLLLSIQETELCNYADDTTIYTCDMHLGNLISRLENDSQIIIAWFANNSMKLNKNKCHFGVFGVKTYQEVSIRIGSYTVKNSKEEKLLGVLIDANLSFEKHVSNVCRKAGNKIFLIFPLSLNNFKLSFYATQPLGTLFPVSLVSLFHIWC